MKMEMEMGSMHTLLSSPLLSPISRENPNREPQPLSGAEVRDIVLYYVLVRVIPHPYQLAEQQEL